MFYYFGKQEREKNFNDLCFQKHLLKYPALYQAFNKIPRSAGFPGSFIFIAFYFLTHGYFVGVAVSYSWDFLICIKLCATMVIALNPPACFVRLVCIKSVSIRNDYQFTDTGLL